jgi:membrane-associated phospholipid phosphatase
VDSDLFRTLNDLQAHTSWLHGPALVYAKTGGPVVLAALVVLGVLLARRRSSAEGVARAAWAGLSPLVAVALNQPLVHAVGRPRPFQALSNVHVLGTPSTDASFPSDHATLAGAVIAGLFLVDRRLGAAASVAGLVLGVDRVYVGAHYPGDVLAGLAFGAVVTLVGWLVLRRPLTATVARLRSSRLRPLVTA